MLPQERLSPAPVITRVQERRAGPGTAAPEAAFDWTGLEEGGGSARGSDQWRWWESFDERFMQARSICLLPHPCMHRSLWCTRAGAVADLPVFLCGLPAG